MNKTVIKNNLKVLANLVSVCETLKETLLKNKDDRDRALVNEVLAEVMNGNMDGDQAWERISSLYDQCEDGDGSAAPSISINPFGDVTVRQPINGGQLVFGLTGPDTQGTKEAAILYANANDDEFDIAMVEQKQGEYAEMDGKPADNKAIDLYVWSDTSTEDYQNKYTFEADDFIFDED